MLNTPDKLKMKVLLYGELLRRRRILRCGPDGDGNVGDTQ